MIDLDYYKIIASDESEMSQKAFEFKLVLRDLIADIERSQKQVSVEPVVSVNFADILYVIEMEGK